jgi:hypothetical protein
MQNEGCAAALRALLMVSQLIAAGIATQRALKPVWCGHQTVAAATNVQPMSNKTFMALSPCYPALGVPDPTSQWWASVHLAVGFHARGFGILLLFRVATAATLGHHMPPRSTDTSLLVCESSRK